MGVLGIVLLVMFVIVSILLVFMVVVQDEGTNSLGGIFAGGSSSAFGARSSNVLTKFTYVLGGLFFVLAFSLALINKGTSGNVEAAAQKQAKDQKSAEWWNAPAQNAAPATLAPEGSTDTTTPATK